MRGGTSDVSLARALARWAVRKPEHLSECEAMFKELNITATALLQLLQLPDFMQALQQGPEEPGVPSSVLEGAAAAAPGAGQSTGSARARAAAAVLPLTAGEPALLRFHDTSMDPQSPLLQQQGQQQHSSSGSGAVQEGGAGYDAEAAGQLVPLTAEHGTSGGGGSSGRLASAGGAPSDGGWALPAQLQQVQAEGRGTTAHWPEPWPSSAPALQGEPQDRRQQSMLLGRGDLQGEAAPTTRPGSRIEGSCAANHPGSIPGMALVDIAGDMAHDLAAVPLTVLEHAGLSISLLPSGNLVARGGPLGSQQLPLRVVPDGSGPQAQLLALLPVALIQLLEEAGQLPQAQEPGSASEERQLLRQPLVGAGDAGPDADCGSSAGDQEGADLQEPQQAAAALAARAAGRVPAGGALPPQFPSVGKSASTGLLPMSAVPLGASVPHALVLPHGAALPATGLAGLAGPAGGPTTLQHQASSSDLGPLQWATPRPEGGTAPTAGAAAGVSSKRRRATPEDDDPDHVEEVGSRAVRGGRGGRLGDGGSQPGGTTPTGSKAPLMCHVDDCQVDLSSLKEYHQRFRICDFHLKAEVVMREGIPQRFCQQCGRFHVLSEFDGSKRSCRARLQRHNARRRKRPEHRDHSGGDAGSDEPRSKSSRPPQHLVPHQQAQLLPPQPPPPPPPPPLAFSQQQQQQPLLLPLEPLSQPPQQQQPLLLPLQQLLQQHDAQPPGGGALFPPPQAAATAAQRLRSDPAVAAPSQPLLRLQQQLELQQGLLMLQQQQRPRPQVLPPPQQTQPQRQSLPALQPLRQMPGLGDARGGGALASLFGIKLEPLAAPTDARLAEVEIGEELPGGLQAAPFPPLQPPQQQQQQPLQQLQPAALGANVGRAARRGSDGPGDPTQVLAAAEALAALAGAAGAASSGGAEVAAAAAGNVGAGEVVGTAAGGGGLRLEDVARGSAVPSPRVPQEPRRRELLLRPLGPQAAAPPPPPAEAQAPTALPESRPEGVGEEREGPLQAPPPPALEQQRVQQQQQQQQQQGAELQAEGLRQAATGERPEAPPHAATSAGDGGGSGGRGDGGVGGGGGGNDTGLGSRTRDHPGTSGAGS